MIPGMPHIAIPPGLVAQVAPGMILGLAALFLFLVWAIATYNGLVRGRNACNESWADVETELKRRYDLIPNLVKTVQGYATHERETLERVIAARNRAAENHGSPTDQARDENQLVGGMKQLFAVAEGYPELKANRNFLALQEELTTTENRIQRARRFYNGNVRDLANRIETFPSSLLAGVCGFTRREYFKIDDSSQREVPHLDFEA